MKIELQVEDAAMLLDLVKQICTSEDTRNTLEVSNTCTNQIVVVYFNEASWPFSSTEEHENIMLLLDYLAANKYTKYIDVEDSYVAIANHYIDDKMNRGCEELDEILSKFKEVEQVYKISGDPLYDKLREITRILELEFKVMSIISDIEHKILNDAQSIADVKRILIEYANALG